MEYELKQKKSLVFLMPAPSWHATSDSPASFSCYLQVPFTEASFTDPGRKDPSFWGAIMETADWGKESWKRLLNKNPRELTGEKDSPSPAIASSKIHRIRDHQKPDRNAYSPLLFNRILGVLAKTRIKKATIENKSNYLCRGYDSFLRTLWSTPEEF